MIEIKGIKKSFGKLEVLKELDLTINKGKITAVLGPNGSGKTTMIKSILGLVLPDGGTLKFHGKSIQKQWEYRKEIGYLPQIARFPENLKVTEIINLIQEVREMKGDFEPLVEHFGLESFMHKRLRQLSGGTRQKVNIVLTFMFDCPVYVLDEPTTGLDPIALIRLKDLVMEENKKGRPFW